MLARGCARLRRYRPFSVPAPAPAAAAAAPAAAAAAPRPAAVPAAAVAAAAAARVCVSPFQGAKLLKAFVPPVRRPAGGAGAPPGSGAEAVEFGVRLLVDSRKQSVRGVVSLPHGIRRTDEKVLVFCGEGTGEVEAALQAGADFAGLTEYVGKIQKGWLGFDLCIATAGVMGKILPIARILGPKKLMPNPKSGTIVTDVAAAVKELKEGGKLEFRASDDAEPDAGDGSTGGGGGWVKVQVGDTGFAEGALLENVKFLVKELAKHRPKAGTAAGAGAGAGAGAAVGAGGNGGWFVEAYVQAQGGPRIALDVDKLHVNGAGYFR